MLRLSVSLMTSGLMAQIQGRAGRRWLNTGSFIRTLEIQKTNRFSIAKNHTKITINKHGYPIPNYLNVEFFRNALSRRINTNRFEIFHIDYSMGTSGVENYLSTLYRVKVSFTQKKRGPQVLSFIVKCVNYKGTSGIFTKIDIYRKEREIYTNLLPQIEDCLGGVRFSPRCYYTQDTPVGTLVFQDMKALGHDVANRVQGLDEAHCTLVLKRLAQFHAGGMKLLKKDPLIRSSPYLQQGIFAPVIYTNFWGPVYADVTLKRLAEIVSKWPGYEEIAKKLETNRQNGTFTQKIFEAMETSPDDLVTILHGDSWVNNFLFKYGKSREAPTNLVMIDFQGSMIGSIGLDLNYFLTTSLHVDMLQKKDDLISSIYHPALCAELEKSAFKQIPSLEDVKAQIRKKAFYGLTGAMVVLPYTSMEDTTDNTFDNMNDANLAENLRDRAYSAPRFLDTMRVLLKEYEGTLFKDL